jgi:hypothetical protein
MTTYWTEFIVILLPGLLLMSLSALPLGLSTFAAFRHLRRQKVDFLVRNVWASTGAGLVALGLLHGALFGSDLSQSSTAALIFVWVPIYSAMAMGIGYVFGRLASRRVVAAGEPGGAQAPIPSGYRYFVWAPAAMLGVLVFGMLKYSVEHNDLAVAERASSPETLHYLYAKVVRGEADPFGVPLFLAQNPNTPADILSALAKHEHLAVRRFVSRHGNTPANVKEALAEVDSDCKPNGATAANSSPQPTPKCDAPERKR